MQCLGDVELALNRVDPAAFHAHLDTAAAHLESLPSRATSDEARLDADDLARAQAHELASHVVHLVEVEQQRGMLTDYLLSTPSSRLLATCLVRAMRDSLAWVSPHVALRDVARAVVRADEEVRDVHVRFVGGDGPARLAAASRAFGLGLVEPDVRGAREALEVLVRQGDGDVDRALAWQVAVTPFFERSGLGEVVERAKGALEGVQCGGDVEIMFLRGVVCGVPQLLQEAVDAGFVFARRELCMLRTLEDAPLEGIVPVASVAAAAGISSAMDVNHCTWFPAHRVQQVYLAARLARRGLSAGIKQLSLYKPDTRSEAAGHNIFMYPYARAAVAEGQGDHELAAGCYAQAEREGWVLDPEAKAFMRRHALLGLLLGSRAACNKDSALYRASHEHGHFEPRVLCMAVELVWEPWSWADVESRPPSLESWCELFCATEPHPRRDSQ